MFTIAITVVATVINAINAMIYAVINDFLTMVIVTVVSNLLIVVRDDVMSPLVGCRRRPIRAIALGRQRLRRGPTRGTDGQALAIRCWRHSSVAGPLILLHPALG